MAIRAQPSVIGQGSAIVIPGSTIFDDSTSDYLSRTPSTEGNRRTWTIGFWVKRGQLSDTQYIFESGTADTAANRFIVRFDSGDTILCTTGQAADKRTNALYRDTSGWGHFVLAVDTTRASADDRFKLYWNGERITSFSSDTNPSQNFEMGVNDTTPQNIGRSQVDGGGYINASLSHFYLIDGQALDASNFGYTDPLTNTWRPKKYTNTFGKNFPNNRGDIWSSVLTAPVSGFTAAAHKFNCFDGVATNAALAGTNNATGANIIFTPSSTIAGVTKLRVYMDHSTSYRTRVNGGSWATDSTLTSDGNASWRDLTSLLSGTDVTSIESDTDGANNGVNWSAIEINGTILVDGGGYGTNGFYLPLDGTGYSAFQTAGNMGQDQSRLQNNYTVNGSPSYTTDSPSGVSGQVNLSGITTTGYPTNYAGISPLFRNSAQGGTNESICVVRKGGTNAWYNSSAGENRFKCNSIDVVLDYTQGGKYYWEMSSAGGDYCQMGLCREERLVDINRSSWGISGPGTGYGYQSDGSWGNNRTTINSAGTAGWTTYGDIVGMVIDMDEYKIMSWVNGTKNSYEVDFSGKIDFRYRHWWPMIALGYNGSDMNAAEDCNIWTGQEPFNYLPDIDNLKPLCAANLSKGTLIRPDTYFKPVMYTGEDASGNSGTGNTWGIPVDVGFDPDLVICKSKTQTYGWYWFDSVRRGNDSQGDPVPGAALECYNFLNSANTSAQGNSHGNGIGLRRNGFNVDVAGQSIGEAGQGANNMIAYCWKAGGYSSTFNKDGVGYASASDAGLDAGSISPTGSSVNTKQGFSIIKYQGNGNNVTISHGLNEAPTLLIQKFVSGSGNWNIWMSALSSTERLTFTDSANDTGYWNSTLPTDTVFSIGSGINDDGVDMIAYLWHDIPGVQKFGRYYGNNQGADGPYIQLGFRPAVVICKGHDFTSNWNILDGTRDTNNLTSHILRFNLTSAQGSTTSGTYAICGDITSNGFKIRAGSATNDINDAGQEFIYLAWAESPFGNFLGAQSNAR